MDSVFRLGGSHVRECGDLRVSRGRSAVSDAGRRSRCTWCSPYQSWTLGGRLLPEAEFSREVTLPTSLHSTHFLHKHEEGPKQKPDYLLEGGPLAVQASPKR